jgi:hypothetical protein
MYNIYQTVILSILFKKIGVDTSINSEFYYRFPNLQKLSLITPYAPWSDKMDDTDRFFFNHPNITDLSIKFYYDDNSGTTIDFSDTLPNLQILSCGDQLLRSLCRPLSKGI